MGGASVSIQCPYEPLTNTKTGSLFAAHFIMADHKPIGKLNWLISAGNIPLATTGEEPEFTSHQKVAILNTSDAEAEIDLTIFYENDQPQRGFEFTVPPRRIMKVRFNDLIDPMPIPLEKNFGCLICSSIPVVVQFSGMDTGHRTTARISTMAYPVQ
jgi:hypothetical protein